MDSKRAFVWAGKYFALTAVFALVGLVLVGGGAALSGLEAYDAYDAGGSVMKALSAGAPGIALAVVGVLVWRFGKAWAFFKTLTAATEEEVGDTFDTEHVKSDIVAVLDDRLTDMQHELQSTNRELRKMQDEDEF